MKAEIVPAILVKNKQEFVQRLRLVETQSKTVHLDVMDGKFVNNETFSDPAAFANLKSRLKLGVHMMVENPAKSVAKWGVAGAFRYVFHWEAVPDDVKAGDLIKKIKKAGMQAGVAINPGTPVKEIESILPFPDCVLVMGVAPGWGGQEFQPSVLKKIAALKKIRKNLIVGVDGGIKLDNAAAVLKAGADFLVIGSAIFEADEPLGQLKKFETLVATRRQR